MHVPVLLNEVLEYINPGTGPKKFVDGTLGGGGHTRAILKANPDCKVLGIDWDQTSLDKTKDALIQEGLNPRVVLVSGNYRDLGKFCKEQEFAPVDGVLIDLGFSSMQIDDPSRGFSFQKDGPLDMRYSRSQKRTAEEVVNEYSSEELAKVLKEYGEEKLARKIAFGIVKARKEKTIRSTKELSDAIISSMPGPVRFKATDSIRRVFQAIRIEVNDELENLKQALPKSLEILNPGGRLVIISFHSLEDRIVKEFFAAQARDCVCPPEFPTCVCEKVSTVRILTRKPIIASEEEQKENPRSAPAKLRAAEKI